MQIRLNHRIFNSKNVAILIAILILIVHYIFRKYNYLDFKNVLGWDILAYYIYLPFNFIYGDPGISDQSIVQYIFETYNPSGTFYQAFPLPNGNWSPMYTLGFSILYFPFFLIGHLWALLSSYAADGFSYPYQFAISNGLMIYIIGGIFIFRKFLLEFLSDQVTTLVLLFMLLGTTFFHEAVVGECGPHSILFAGLSAILYLNHKWHKKPTTKTAFILGFISGLVVLSRASTIFIAIIPVLWNVYDKESLIAKIQFLYNKRRQIFIGLIGLSIVPLIQITYWKFVTGEYLFNTYMMTPGFNWTHPQFMKVLFSYKKGWLLYTPMISFIIIGLYFIYKNNKKIAASVILFFSVYLYVISSWGTWWGGGSFGARYFVESYAVLGLPLGYFIHGINNIKWGKHIFYPIGFFFIFLNLFQTWQFNNWIFDGYTMNKKYYWKVFLKTSVSEEDRKYKDIERDFLPVDVFKNPQDYTARTAKQMSFEGAQKEGINSSLITDRFAKSGSYSCEIDSSRGDIPIFTIPFTEVTNRDHAWIKLSFDYFSEYNLKEVMATLVIEMDHNDGQYLEKRRVWDIKNEDYIKGNWGTFQVDYLTPTVLNEDIDIFKMYINTSGSKPLYIDNFKVDVYERNW